MGKSPEIHEQECKSAGHVATAAQLSLLITVRSVIRTASDIAAVEDWVRGYRSCTHG